MTMTPDEPRPYEEPTDLDALASAIVDGEATLPADPDPALVDRVRAFRAVREAVAAPVAGASDAVREAAVSAALAASTTSPDVHSLATRRRRVPVLPAAVAAALALFVGLAVLNLGGDARDADMAGAPAASRVTETTAALETTAAAGTQVAEKLMPTRTFVPSTAAPATAAPTTAAPTTTVAVAGVAEQAAADGDAAATTERSGDDAAYATDLADDALSSGFIESAGDDPPVTTMPDGVPAAEMVPAVDWPFAGDDGAFTFLIPHAVDVADAIRAGRVEASTPATEGDACPAALQVALDGEEHLGLVVLHESWGDQVFEALLVVGPDTWEMVLTDTCATYRYPPIDEE